MSSPIPYRYIPEGAGGTFALREANVEELSTTDDQMQRSYYIGTWEVFTCVGVFFMVDENRCFIAHIDACVHRPNISERHRYDRNVSNKEGEQIKQATLELLRAEAATNGWTPDTRYALPSLAMISPLGVCPKDPSVKMSGAFIADAINEFLDAQDHIQLSAQYHGMIAGKMARNILLNAPTIQKRPVIRRSGLR